MFGEKDYQQLLVIERMARDLDIPTRILSSPTLREDDGLAMSSRNVYLSAEDRRRAPALYRTLCGAAGRILEGEEIGHVMGEAREALVGAGFVVDYLEARHGATLARVVTLEDGPIRLLAAAKVGATRLIDNIPVGSEMNPPRSQSLRISVEGRVQGVGYRAFVQREADRLQLTGWVRNRADGTVEIVVTGEAAAVDQFVETVRRGPLLANVEALRVADAAPEALQETGGGRGFRQAPTV